jgi:hypothetical protein
MATATTRLGEWNNGTVFVDVNYDDVTFVVSSVRVVNNSGMRCRFKVWRTGQEQNAIIANLNNNTDQTFKPAGTVTYRPTENPDGVTPASNLWFRMEVPY